MKTILTNAFQSEGFSLNDTQLNQFADYFDMLIEWNQKINLTAIEEPVEVAYKHFVDSACLLRVVPDLKHKTMIDIGTGAGFPGVPLKIMEPELDLTLFDSLNKLIGTGFAQPNPHNSIHINPIGSRCLKGLSVILPRFFAVGSPSLLAANPCAAS